MTAQITPFPGPRRAAPRSDELDVIARACPDARDLQDQVGTLFVDRRPDGTVHEVTFQPAYERLKNAVIAVTAYAHREENVEVVDADDGRRWSFEVYTLDLYEETGDEDDWDEDDRDEDDWDEDDGEEPEA